MFDVKTLRCMRRLAIVPRWQIVPTLREQSVLEHSVGVLMIAGYIAEQTKIDFDKTAIMAALCHDKIEAVEGDVPSTAKTPKNPKDNNDVTRVLIKFADYLESLVYLDEEQAMGNARLDAILYNVSNDAYKWGDRLIELLNPELDTNMKRMEVISDLTRDVLEVYSAGIHAGLEYRGEQ